MGHARSAGATYGRATHNWHPSVPVGCGANTMRPQHNGEARPTGIACTAVDGEHVGFAHARQAVQVERTVTHKKSGKETTGSRQFILSTEYQPGATGARQVGTLVRHHWRVENNIHWLRDAVWREDSCRSRNPNSACALALLRTALLASVRASGRESLTEAIEEFAADRNPAIALIRNQRLASLLDALYAP